MKSDWVAASVRARSLAQRRVGAGASRTIAAQLSLEGGLSLLENTVYAHLLDSGSTLAAAERATHDTVLWQLRVLAGWMPGAGTRLARAAAGAYERDNILTLFRRLADESTTVEPFELGSLASAWPRLQLVTSTDELTDALRTSVWGDPGPGDTTALQDVLTLAWLRRLTEATAAARPWAVGVATVTVARLRLVDRAEPSTRMRQLVRPLLGDKWETAADLTELRSFLPRSAQAVLLGISTPDDLWRAESRLRASVEADGFRLMRGSLPGPDIVLGAIAVLAVDAWRVRAALAAAASGTGSSEVLDAVA
ncbi:hypothetical protein [Cryobacterium sp. PH29-G1]|uniref:hypothetical protein n=1 Tax=Cryobacterium sp. PH29-G1 TaxID=3046211 RepID=UPI0024BA15A1|nr:hypothetical protein [Cryobacterium sp. PH29-G1]MDJ0348018.1 hypothetical protein [Cryobacterium sp. PH29-G1]